jgi:hypothetical protein
VKKALYALGMGLLLFSACMNPLGEKAETGDAPKNRGLVKIQVGSGARTLRPGPGDFSRYALTFGGSFGASHVEELTEDTTKTVELSAGAWTITATAYSGTGEAEKKAAEGSVRVSVVAGETADAAITLSPYTGEGAAPGTLNYTVDYPPGIASGSITITGADGSEVPGGTIDDVATVKTGSLSLAAGAYRLQIRLTDRAGLSAGSAEALHIYPGLITTLNRTFEPEDFVAFAELGDVTVTGLAATKGGTGEAVNADLVITLYHETFEAIGTESLGWIRDLPGGLSLALKSPVSAGEREITLSLTGIPQAPSTAALAIDIPKAVLAGGKGLTVSNPSAKFAIGEPSVDAVRVSPASATLTPGTTGQFRAEVDVTGGASKDLTWTVEGASKAGTGISNDGELTLAGDEPDGTSFTVRATSAVDPATSGTATVRVAYIVDIRVGFNGDIILIGDDGTNTISKSGNETLTLEAEGYENPTWYINGAATGTSGKRIIITAGNYEIRRHSVSFTGTKDGVLYAKAIRFTVVD